MKKWNPIVFGVAFCLVVLPLSLGAAPSFECPDAGLVKAWHESVGRHRAGADAADPVRRLREGRWLDDADALKREAAAAIRTAKPGSGIIRAIGDVTRATGDRSVIAPLLDDCERHYLESQAAGTNATLMGEAYDFYLYIHLCGRNDLFGKKYRNDTEAISRAIGARPHPFEEMSDPAYVCDYIVTAICGLLPLEGVGLVVRPRAPESWDWFRLSDVPYHGKPLDIIWDRTGAKFGHGKGLTVVWGDETAIRRGELRPKLPLAGYSDICDPNDIEDFDLFGTVLRKAGYDVRFIPYQADTNALAASVADLDLFVLVGGHDIDPRRWGDERKPWCGEPHLARDDYDWALVTAVTNRGIPMVGICRGEQLLNVFFGGTMYQDIRKEYPGPGEPVPQHGGDRTGILYDADDANGPRLAHDLLIEKGSWLHRLTGLERMRVNSHHHQAAKRIAPGWRVTGRAPDGTVEFIECSTYPAVASQFHPECMGAHAYDPDMHPETWIRFFSVLKDLKPTATGLLSASPASADALDDLLPVPVRIERLGGSVPSGSCAVVKTIRGEVPGSRSETADEAYVLEVCPDGVTVTARTGKGERWAKVTLKQLVKLSGGQVPCCRITDWPRYRYRGFMIDVARNFLEMDELKALVDVMGDYKLNAFHWHLTENYCWRLESKRHPELQGPNGWYDPYKVRHSGRFYTQEEFKELVDYAWARGVSVVPEFDLPGHSAAFRQAFGLKGMDDPRALEISLDLYDELCDLVPAEKMPVIHMGMDEVWDKAEQPSKGMYSAWAKKLVERGRVAANWGGSGPLVIEGATRRMLFGFGDGIAGVYYEGEKRDAKVANGVEAFVDPKWYIEEDDPFELLCRAAYTAPFSTAAGRKLPDGLKAGAEFCAWHDSAVGLPTANAFRNQQVFPSCVLYGDLFWRGRERDYPEFERRLPPADDPRLDIAKDLERRAIAHRDRIFADFKYPFCFLRQTDMRWRLSHADGRLIAKDIAQATVFPFRKKDKPLNFVDDDHGDVVMETWIRSPKDQVIGAWIGFTAYDRDHGRGRARGTPPQGQWNNVGATVEVNGERIPPPRWENPDIPDGGPNWIPLIKYQYPSDEIPFRNEEYYMREPTKVRFRAGWNHVKLHLPMPHAVNWVWRRQWVGTFIPVAGTTDHPREVEGLEYASEDPERMERTF